ncbi:ABC transporter thiamine pyrophosphate-binding lipoprotein p37/Cypl [Mycoplasma sp. OR1901]|uniref:ABC transporter thiamine pyrophosphate-binding lipoprotein p37/Cypl n=1 Tax=Mycoplasma sp. OR1901 TaxID=2742195 RepID=UPI0015839D99|nr:PhnD/SsuA/transferrin family substrate-binding protein [Mycoplasma sp. OR1901]QKT05548.1 PhnD/SsuA/transferrin family substrate-binding protein [Mycoplasma sp. OR1901]
MKTKFLNKIFFGGLAFTSIPLVALSCSNKDKENLKEVKLSIYTGEAQGNLTDEEYNKILSQYKSQYNQFISDLNEELKLINPELKLDINIKGEETYENQIQSIQKNETDIVFLSSASIYEKKEDLLKRSGGKLFLQTYTRKFKGQESNDQSYVDGSTNDPLRKIALNEYELYKNKSNYTGSWNGAIYQDLYQDSNNLTPFQRGMIIIVADENTKNEIVKAWEDKDYDKFISYGIGIGSQSSGSKYILPQALFKKHFGPKYKSFLNLQQDPKMQSYIKKVKFKEKDTNKDIHIFLDNEGSYAYTKESKLAKYYESNERPNEKIHFLTVTDVFPYNVGLKSKRISDKDANDISQALINLSKKGKDIFGSSNGFNGYKLIENAETEFWDIIEKSLGKK